MRFVIFLLLTGLLRFLSHAQDNEAELDDSLPFKS